MNFEEHKTLPPVVIVDDRPDELERMRNVVRETGLRNPVLSFTSAEEVMHALGGASSARGYQGTKPELIIADVNMPAVSGFELVRWIRSQPQLEKVKVLLVTSTVSESIARAGAQLGADAVLAKYPAPETFAAMLRDWRQPQLEFD